MTYHKIEMNCTELNLPRGLEFRSYDQAHAQVRGGWHPGSALSE
jgi:hypothetical protein